MEYFGEELRSVFREAGLGTHFTSIYGSKLEQFATVIPFIQIGLEQHEKCLYVVDDRTRAEVIDAFRRADVELDPYLASNQLEFRTKKETYLQDGYFAPAKMIKLLRDTEETALANGYTGLRATGEMTWFYTDLPGVERLIEYEVKLNKFLSGSHTVALCQYNEGRFSPAILRDVIYAHPRLILYGSLYENPYYLPPEHMLARLKGESSGKLYHTMVQELQERARLRERYQDFFEASPDPVFLLNADGVFIDVNPAAVEKLGFERSDIVDSTLWDAPFFPEATIETITQKFRRRKAGEEIPPYTVVLEKKNGGRLFVEVNVGTIELQGEFWGEIVIARDITERKHMEKSYQEIFNNVAEAITIHDKKTGEITAVNDAACDLWGYTKEEFIGLPLQALTETEPPFTGERSKALLHKAAKEGPLTFEWKDKKKDGTTFWTEVHLNVAEIQGNERVIAAVRDITKRKKKEEKLKEAKERFKSIVEHANDGIFIIDEDGTITYANQKLANILGYPLEEILGKKSRAFLHPDTLHELQQENILEKMSQGKILRRELKIQTKSGDIKYADSNTAPLTEGDSSKVIGIVRDITERKQTRQKLETLHSWGQRLNRADSMDEIYKYTLDAVETTLGFEHADIDLKKADTLKLKAARGSHSIPKELHEVPLHSEGIIPEVATTGQSILVENVKEYPNYLSVSPSIKSELAVPIKTGEQVLGVLNVESEEKHAFDQRDKRLLETLASHVAVAIKELQEKKKRVSLQRLDELRNQFLAMAGHEINTPLTPIKSNLEMLQQEYFGELTEEQQQRIAQTLESVDRLVRLVNDFRRTSQLQAAHITLDEQEHQLAHTIEKALKQYKYAIVEENIRLVKQMEQPLTAVYDEDRMIQVFRNLIENALDYTDDTIWIHGRAHDDHIQVSVRDNGPGIPEDEQKKIFQPFYRVEDEARSREGRRFGGTGLGLNICKRIIEAHRGEIHVDSTRGGETTFTVTIPRQERNNEVKERER